MLYGIQASKDVKLSNISKTLKEEQSLIKTEDRLSRNLDDQDFTDAINEEIMRLVAPKIREDMVIAIDPGDLRKKYGEKMEFLGKETPVFFLLTPDLDFGILSQRHGVGGRQEGNLPDKGTTRTMTLYA